MQTNLTASPELVVRGVKLVPDAYVNTTSRPAAVVSDP